MMKAVVMFVAVLMLSGCNTMEGLGKDIQKGGEQIQKAVNK